MADISKYLEDILSAIYGEEVRHSIHDAIAAINDEVYTGVEDAKAEVAKAAAQAANAASSAQSAASEADRATVAANNAGSSAGQAYMSATEAGNQASNAASSASSAAGYASQAAASATLSQSWATGDTASRAGEESNNSKYYAEQAQRALSAISGSLVPMGTITFEQLPSEPLQPGVMYNISNEFTTDNRFNEGAGHKYGAGTNVYWTGESKWDCLAAPGGIDENAFILRGAINNNWRPSKPGAYTFDDSDMQIDDAPKELSWTYGMLLVFYSDPDTVTYLAIPHQIDTRFAFRQMWRSLENLSKWKYIGGSSATISPYVSTPLPPSTTGSAGIAEEYARGDHVHPMQEGIAKINSIPGSSDLNDFKNVGLYVCFTSDSAQTILNTPTQYAFTLMVIHSTINDTAVIQLVWPYTDLHIYYRGYNGEDWGDWHTISNISDITASNFTGILPIEKGGTGNTYGHPCEFFDDAYVDGGSTAMATVGAVIKNTAKGNNLMAACGAFANKYSVRAFLGVGEVHFALDNNIAIQQNAADKSIIGTYKGREIATLTDYATSSKAGLVKPGAGLQVSEDGTLNVVQSIVGHSHTTKLITGVKVSTTANTLTLIGVNVTDLGQFEKEINTISDTSVTYNFRYSTVDTTSCVAIITLQDSSRYGSGTSGTIYIGQFTSTSSHDTPSDEYNNVYDKSYILKELKAALTTLYKYEPYITPITEFIFPANGFINGMD